ncbi:hypothetical protein TIFTF001_053754 [Ficus carica]|uniref:Uncharacterized protein n=1 Tax=Ficus carica TaxID=3494 RepID=A0AA88ENG6_FICCA|nr:hypothetical protein TIFTF001_053754 [Ficus carica]
MRELEITENGEPREKVKEVTHPFTAEVIAIPIPKNSSYLRCPYTMEQLTLLTICEVIIGNSEEESSDRKKRPANNGSHESSEKRQKSGNDNKSLQLFKRFETYTEPNTGIEDINYDIHN